MDLRPLFVAAVAAALPMGSLAAAGPIAPPEVHIASIDALTVPARPFDADADAVAAIDEAFLRARDQHKRVLIDLGANWCADCRILVAIMELPEIRSFVETHYTVVHVDVGRLDRNMVVAARFGVSHELQGLPGILVATSDRQLVNRGHIEALDDMRRLTPQAVADWLAAWAQ